MRRLLTFCQRNALSGTMLLTTIAIGLCAYALVTIQGQRADAIYRACADQNQRHAGTVRELHSLLKRAEVKQPKRAAQIAASEGPTLLLIDQLAPYQNCTKAVAKATH